MLKSSCRGLRGDNRPPTAENGHRLASRDMLISLCCWQCGLKSVTVIFENEFDRLTGQTGSVARSRNHIPSVTSWEMGAGEERLCLTYRQTSPQKREKNTLTWCNNHLSAGPEMQRSPRACLPTVADSTTKTLPPLQSRTPRVKVEATVSQSRRGFRHVSLRPGWSSFCGRPSTRGSSSSWAQLPP